MLLRHRLVVGAVVVLLMTPLLSTVAAAQTDPMPWETPSGRACFDAWIRETTSTINAWDGSDQFNARKPWTMNEYGLFEGNPRIGPTSVAPPDNFPQYGNDRYWWMWVHYPVSASYQWPSAEWRNAGVPPPM